jgi:hypothetical protein
MMNINGEVSRILLFLDCGALLTIKNYVRAWFIGIFTMNVVPFPT